MDSLRSGVSSKCAATSRTATKRSTPRQDDARFNVPATSIHRVEADGVQVFYREAGNTAASKLLLLHGFPSDSGLPAASRAATPAIAARDLRSRPAFSAFVDAVQ